jgi:hypothetical protein
MERDEETTLWARWRLYVLLQEIACRLVHKAEGREDSARVMREAASRLDVGD